MQHSHHPDGSVVVYTRAEWAAFLAGAKDGEFDFNGQRTAAELLSEVDQHRAAHSVSTDVIARTRRALRGELPAGICPEPPQSNPLRCRPGAGRLAAWISGEASSPTVLGRRNTARSCCRLRSETCPETICPSAGGPAVHRIWRRWPVS
nr:DUF397 domain-containing protein [Glycomyces salinus]